MQVSLLFGPRGEVPTDQNKLGQTSPLPLPPLNTADDGMKLFFVYQVKWRCKYIGQAKGCTPLLSFAPVASRVEDKRQSLDHICMKIFSSPSLGFPT